jgi:hypothetical protein
VRDDPTVRIFTSQVQAKSRSKLWSPPAGPPLPLLISYDWLCRTVRPRTRAVAKLSRHQSFPPSALPHVVYFFSPVPSPLPRCSNITPPFLKQDQIAGGSPTRFASPHPGPPRLLAPKRPAHPYPGSEEKYTKSQPMASFSATAGFSYETVPRSGTGGKSRTSR